MLWQVSIDADKQLLQFVFVLLMNEKTVSFSEKSTHLDIGEYSSINLSVCTALEAIS